MTIDETLTTGLVLLHFFASAAALVTLVRTDILLLSHYNNVLTSRICARIHSTKAVIGTALLVLWFTGFAICVQGYLQDPDYILNQKLWMKLAVVIILSLNGWCLHRFAFRWVTAGTRLCDIHPSRRTLQTLLASISSGSWLFACFLGVARALNNKPNLAELATGYLLLVTAIFVCALLLTSQRAQSRQPLSN